LQRLSFVKQPTAAVEAEKEDPAAALTTKMWQALEGEERKGVSSENLKMFVGAVLKIMYSHEGAHDSSKPAAPLNNSKYGSYTPEGLFMVDQAQATRIHKDFILFYLNRTAYSLHSPQKPA
jgi:hypothetical protein